MKILQAVRGMNDILPDDSVRWQRLETQVRTVLQACGYREIRFPIVEATELFARSIGEVTDIVEKEMYTFADRNGDSLTLRPEGTACCVRACLEHGLLHNQTPRLWYGGPMFRHERPQKGRYRQFHQIGIEAFGMAGPDIDAELICLTARLWRQLGLGDVRLELNTLGSPEARQSYRAALVAYLQQHLDALDADSQRRLASNPLRILDSKDAATRAVLAEAPRLDAHLDAGSRRHFDDLCASLSRVGVPFVVNASLVRGLDYYTGTVFEWVTDRLGAQGTVCAGGRYDGLVEQLGGKPVPAVGCAMGVERLLALLADQSTATPPAGPDVYLLAVGEAATVQALPLAERLRDAVPGLTVLMNAGGGSMKAQFRRADRSGARHALVLADDELASGCYRLKPLRDAGEQCDLDETSLIELLRHTVRTEPRD